MNAIITTNFLHGLRTKKRGASIISVMLFSSYSITHTNMDLETARETIIKTLEKEHPKSIEKFTKFFKTYDTLATSFFDKTNNDSLQTHVTQMENELHTLKKTCDQTCYKSIKSILEEYHMYIASLIGVLKEYIGSHNTFACAWKLREYKHVLPHDVKKRSEFSLYWSLDHRLKC